MAACRLAMADVRVRLPLGALDFRVWESLVFRVLREHEIAGSNPAILTYMIRCGQTVRQRPVKPTSGGSSPPTGAFKQRKGKPIGDGSRFESGRAMSLEGSTPSLSAFMNVPLADRQRLQPSKLARRVRFPQGTLG